MVVYLLGRLTGILVVFTIVSMLAFVLMHSIPGGPFDEEKAPLPPAAKENILHKYGLGWLPTGGWPSGGDSDFKALILPVVTLALGPSALVARYTRSSLVEVLHAEYIRTARAKGLRDHAVVLGHALKNALIPLITILLPQIPNLITGTIFVEVIFRVPGLGKFFVSSIYLRDYPMIMATMLLVATLCSFTYLGSDLLYTVVDPRVRLFGKST